MNVLYIIVLLVSVIVVVYLFRLCNVIHSMITISKEYSIMMDGINNGWVEVIDVRRGGRIAVVVARINGEVYQYTAFLDSSGFMTPAVMEEYIALPTNSISRRMARARELATYTVINDIHRSGNDAF